MRCPRAAEPLRFAATPKSDLYDFETRTETIRRVFFDVYSRPMSVDQVDANGSESDNGCSSV